MAAAVTRCSRCVNAPRTTGGLAPTTRVVSEAATRGSAKAAKDAEAIGPAAAPDSANASVSDGSSMPKAMRAGLKVTAATTSPTGAVRRSQRSSGIAGAWWPSCLTLSAAPIRDRVRR